MPALTDQRITAVDVGEVTSVYPRTVGRNARLGSHGNGFGTRAIRLHTREGLQGWGIAEGSEGDPGDIIGREVGELFDPATGITSPRLRWLDLALHDLAARAAGQSVATMLGNHGPSTIDVYSGAIYFDDLDPQDAPRGLNAVLDNCASDWDAGYRAFKLKIGRGNKWMEREAGFARDIDVIRAVREAYPDARLLVDVNDGYDVDRTIALVNQTLDCHLYWIEEPFAETVADLRRLRDHLATVGSGTLIADGEAHPDEAQLLQLAEQGLLDVLLMDVVSYGISAWRRVMPTLAQLGVVASPHAWGKPIKTLYAAHLAAGLGNVNIVEGVPGRSDGADTSAYTFSDGRLTVPDAPGFGIDLTSAVTTTSLGD